MTTEQNNAVECTETEEGWGDTLDAFIKKWIPSYYAHLSDSDENDGERLRESIRNSLQSTRAKAIKDVIAKISQV